MDSTPPYPSLATPDVLDDFFVKGRNLWPDLDRLKDLRLERSLVPDKVLKFMRSTALNEYGVAHYLRSYLESYGNDFKLRMWSAMWTAEEYVHYLVLRRMLEALGEPLTETDFRGLEESNFFDRYKAYFDVILVSPKIDPRMAQLIYGVLQEYAAVIAYTAAAEQCNVLEMETLFRRIARDEMRHCRFNQVALEAMFQHCSDDERTLVWPQFRAFWKDLRMPQEHIDYFGELDMGTELYTSLWSGELRSRMVLYLTHYFRKFRTASRQTA